MMMRTGELLNALASHNPGIEVFVNSEQAIVNTLYEPGFCSVQKTLFQAALEVGSQLFGHPDCPESVQKALEAYDQHSAFLEI
jgi:hypothetical protein